jgi:uncharacterized delta-60 repeat protein
MKKITLTSCIFYFTFCICHAQSPGSLDNTFGTNGVVSTGFGGIYETAQSVVIQSDGKIVVAGSSGHEEPRIGVFAIARYNSSNGSLDNTFGTGGTVNTRFVDENFYNGHAVALQGDGKIVVAGNRVDTTTGTISSFAMARYNSDGSLDNVWGTLTGTANSVALQSDGKIVVAGTSGSGIGIIRYNTNCSYDATFGSGGIVTTTVGSSCHGNSVAIQGDGKIVVAGGNGDFLIVRYNNDGSLDNTFGVGGIITTDFGSSSDDGRSVTIQSDGKIVVAGSSDNGTLGVVALARYNSNGSLDNTFGAGGKVTTFDGSDGMAGNSVAIQSDGKIVVAGSKNDNSISGLGQSDFAVVMYNSNGSLDNTFGTGGIASTHIYVGDDILSAAIQSDGKIVVAGYTMYTDGPYWEVARFNNNVFSGIEKPNNNASEIKIFPNPSSGVITLGLKNKTIATKICVTDVLGNCLLNKVCQNEGTPAIDLAGQPKGIYLIEIVSDDERVVKKIVLE